MNKEIIEKQLRTWFAQRTKKYSWLRIKFEFSENRGVYMISFAPAEKIELSDDFNLDAMQFADDMNDNYGSDAPLFTDEEQLFKLSAGAETIGGEFFTVPVIASSVFATACVWTSPIESQVVAKSKSNFYPSESEVVFSNAA